MALSATILSGLEVEHRRLKDEAARLAGEAARANAEADEIGALLARHGTRVRIEGPKAKAPPARVPDPNGLRAAVLKILNEGTRAYTTAEMFEALRARQFEDPSDSKVSLRARISNDLARLYRNRKIGKGRNGQYMALSFHDGRLL